MSHYVSLSLTNKKSSVHLYALYSPRTALRTFTPRRDQLVICGQQVNNCVCRTVLQSVPSNEIRQQLGVCRCVLPVIEIPVYGTYIILDTFNTGQKPISVNYLQGRRSYTLQVLFSWTVLLCLSNKFVSSWRRSALSISWQPSLKQHGLCVRLRKRIGQPRELLGLLIDRPSYKAVVTKGIILSLAETFMNYSYLFKYATWKKGLPRGCITWYVTAFFSVLFLDTVLKRFFFILLSII
jgi:hypothetical protein